MKQAPGVTGPGYDTLRHCCPTSTQIFWHLSTFMVLTVLLEYKTASFLCGLPPQFQTSDTLERESCGKEEVLCQK